MWKVLCTGVIYQYCISQKLIVTLKLRFPINPKNYSRENLCYQIKLKKHGKGKQVKKMEGNQVRERSYTSDFTNELNIELLTQMGVQ